MNKQPLYAVGDTVRVKKLSRLVFEFGEDINVPSAFMEDMQDFCDRDYVIERIYSRPDGRYAYIFRDDDEKWHFDECVLELPEHETDIRPDSDSMSFDDLMMFT